MYIRYANSKIYGNAAKFVIQYYIYFNQGPQAWPIPAVEVDYPESIEKYKWFAVYLLDGTVREHISQPC